MITKHDIAEIIRALPDDVLIGLAAPRLRAYEAAATATCAGCGAAGACETWCPLLLRNTDVSARGWRPARKATRATQPPPRGSERSASSNVHVEPLPPPPPARAADLDAAAREADVMQVALSELLGGAPAPMPAIGGSAANDTPPAGVARTGRQSHADPDEPPPRGPASPLLGPQPPRSRHLHRPAADPRDLPALIAGDIIDPLAAPAHALRRVEPPARPRPEASALPVMLEIIPIERLTSRGQRFLCVPLGAKITAATCIERQQMAERHRNEHRWGGRERTGTWEQWRRCEDCGRNGPGKQVRERIEEIERAVA